MFTTLRCSSDTLVATQADSSHTNLACNTCRSKKLKCTREKGGCHRCISRDIECEYPDPTQRKSKTHKSFASGNRVKPGVTRPSVVASTVRDALSSNPSRSSPRSPRIPDSGTCLLPVRYCNTIRSHVTERSCDIDRPNDIDRSHDVDRFEDLRYGTDHQFEESLNLSADSADSLDFFPIDVRLLEESDFFFPPWGQASPSMNEEPLLTIPTLPTNQYLTPESNPDGPCQCTAQALALLEDVVHHDTLGTLSSVPTDLSINKRALVRCRKLLDCQYCSSTSAFVTLLILLCQQIIISYENIIAKLCEQFNKIRSDNLFTARDDDIDQLPAQSQTRILEHAGTEDGMLNNLVVDKRLLFKDYEVDIEEEPCVFGGLTSMQLKTLVLFLGRLRGLTGVRAWGTHRLMVDAVEKRGLALLRVTSSCGGKGEAD